MKSDVENALAAVQNLLDSERYMQVYRTLDDIVGRNQNPGCGGDGSMSIEQWESFRDVRDLLFQLRTRMEETVVLDTGRAICDDPWWSEENKKRRNI